jgi:hypothetical protein
MEQSSNTNAGKSTGYLFSRKADFSARKADFSARNADFSILSFRIQPKATKISRKKNNGLPDFAVFVNRKFKSDGKRKMGQEGAYSPFHPSLAHVVELSPN